MDLLGQYSSDEDTHASSEITAGKLQLVRAFPHVEGNYSTHVYLSVHLTDEAVLGLRSLLRKASSSLPNLMTSTESLSGANPSMAALSELYHVSLSRVVPIRFKDIESLLVALRFQMRLSSLQAFVNEQRTRSFLALRTTDGKKQVCKLISQVNQAFRQHGFQTFHQDPQPHISIAWWVGDVEKELKDWISANANVTGQNGLEVYSEVHSVWCKIGNKIHNVWAAT